MSAERKPPGVLARVFGAMARRRDPELSIAQVMAQWAEYELIFNDILQRLNAQLARQAKYEKRRLEAQTAEAPPVQPVTPTYSDPKQALRSRYAAQRYGGRIQALLNAKEQPNESPDRP